MSGIQKINIAQLVPSAPPPPTAAAGEVQGASFKDFLVDSIQQVNTMQQQADKQVESLFSGGDVNPAEVLTAVQKADLAFKMMMQVRNKLVQVYQEVRDVRI
jgi:flagellar hook-basal body complex protein FliE